MSIQYHYYQSSATVLCVAHLIFSETKNPCYTGAEYSGRHPHILLELFKYISENPESSDRLQAKLRKPAQAKRSSLEKLVY